MLGGDDTIAESARSPSCELIDARLLDDVPPRYIAAVQRGLRSAKGPARRVALVVPLAAWLRFGEGNMPAHHTLRLFHPAQFDSFAVHQWIRFAQERELDLEPLIASVGVYLAGSRASFLLGRAAGLIRRERWEIEDRAKLLGRLLLGARTHVSFAERPWLEAEVRMLFGHAAAAPPSLGADVRATISATVQRVVQREPPIGAPPSPWHAWLAVALVRYRAGQLAFLRRHASGIFTEADVGGSTHRILTKKEIRDSERAGWAGMMVSATADDGTGVHGVVDRRWFSPAWFAHFICGSKERAHGSRRLWRWMPSQRGLIGLALHFIREIGGEVIIDSEHGRWCALPPALETLVSKLSTDDLQLISIYHEDYLDPATVDAHCGDPETAASLSVHLADTQARHRAWVETKLARGERGLSRRCPSCTRARR